MLNLSSCPKRYSLDQDKAVNPAETLKKVHSTLAALDLSILSEVKRVDNGRLGIPVYLSIAGANARQYLPTRKQMGKGATQEQAEASAVMELMERYGFFTFWQRLPEHFEGSWDAAKAKYGQSLLPIREILKSVQDKSTAKQAEAAMNLLTWNFFPVLHIQSGKTLYAPLDWFKTLAEFTGSSAGNTDVESILQGACELVERHVSCLAEETHPELPTIEQNSIEDRVVLNLLTCFARNGIKLILKDFSLGMPVPTIAAIAYDPVTFPDRSEIVYTAGTASSPTKAAIRALTEVAQLGGDFISGSCYEASGLPKYSRMEDIRWLEKGPQVPLSTLPSIAAEDLLDELKALSGGLKTLGYNLYSIATTSPDTQIPTHYSFVPGFKFRQRDKNASIGLFVGRILAENLPPAAAASGIDRLEQIFPGAHYLPFFRALLALRSHDHQKAGELFAQAEPLQPDDQARGLSAFYSAYCLTSTEKWREALPLLERAVNSCPEMKEYLNLRGVCHYKLKNYTAAAADFEYIIRRLDKGSAQDLANLGICNKYLGDRAKAAHYLNAALAIEPTLDFARNHLAELLKK